MNRPPIVRLALILCAAWASTAPAQSPEPIRLAAGPALSPDGSTLAFSWAGDIWTVPTAGGVARPLTRHPAKDTEPAFSPDGKAIAFVSDREGSAQVFLMPAEGGPPRQVTYHTAGQALEGWFPDGKAVLVRSSRDQDWRRGGRLFKARVDERAADELLFDDYGGDADVSPDGKTLLFNREGIAWWRKGYRGSQAAQIWTYDLGSKAFAEVLAPDGGAIAPLWKPDGKGFYYVGMNKGAFNLREFVAGKDTPLTNFEDDSVVFPALSRDGSTLVFRHLFDLYAYHPAKDETPTKIEVARAADDPTPKVERRAVTTASQVAFTRDGLEMAFIAGGDLWVMDTELMEPRQVTRTPEEERDPAFAPDGSSLVFVSDADGQGDLWKATKADAEVDWWRNTGFKLDRLSGDPEVEHDPKFSPDGSRVAFIKGLGDLWTMGPDGKDARRILPARSLSGHDWSPDGRWFVFAMEDDDFNDDIYVMPSDASSPPYNLSRHPDDDGDPAWSPDGKVIAFTGRRADTEVDIYFTYLRDEDDDKDKRDRTLEKAIEKMKARAKKGPAAKGMAKADAPNEAEKAAADAPKDKEPAKPAEPPKVVIDFDRIHERIRRVSIPDSAEDNLFWSPDSKKLAFTGTVEGKRGAYTIEPPDDLKPKPLSTSAGTQARWLEAGNQVVWLSNGVPGSVSAGGPGGQGGSAGQGAAAGAGGKETAYRFRALQEVDLPRKYRAGFDLAWRTMRDRYYDGRLGNRSWDAIRRKYADAAATAPDPEGLGTVISLMLGELNGSHLGFTPGQPADPADPAPGPRRGPAPAPAPGAPPDEPRQPRNWQISTAHLGLRFDDAHKGPGLRVKDVVPDGPTDAKRSKVEPGEVVTQIDGVAVDPSMDLTRVLNGPPERDLRLTVRDAAGKDREVLVRPISLAAARQLLYSKWIRDNRKAVDAASKGALGYLHIRGMDQPSFHKFEEDLYAAAAGKDGLVIDVRENGGGSTADLLLTALTQPEHATTIPRGGGPGYPQDRRIFATWTKPIVVLCNQNSFSNAEIFSHAIKTLRRGHLVGVPTAGGVLSTGGTAIMDLGFLRLPFRGWYLRDTGEDMELNGCVPDVVLWPRPGDMPRGQDDQLAKAVEVLSADVAEAKAKPRPKLRKATER